MRFYFARSSRRHRIGRRFALEALADAGAARVEEPNRFHWIGKDSRGVELHIIGAMATEDPDLMIIFHVMPTHFTEAK